MASAPATVKYRLPSGGNLGDIKVGRKLVNSKQLRKWAQTRTPKTATQERQEAADRLKRTRPLSSVNQKNKDTQHNNDMYRIGGGPVVVTGKDSKGRNKRAPVIAQDRARISFAKGPDGKIISERKAQTLAASKPVNRPFGKPSATGTLSPAYARYKNNSLEYNAALSRQQMAQPNNRVIQKINPTSENPTKKYPAPITKAHLPRGGSAGRTPSSKALKVLNKEQPNIQVV
jgi:hypothetical protein